MVNNYRKNKKGGGVAVCIKDSLLYKCREDLDKSNVDTECFYLIGRGYT